MCDTGPDKYDRVLQWREVPHADHYRPEFTVGWSLSRGYKTEMDSAGWFQLLLCESDLYVAGRRKEMPETCECEERYHAGG